MSVLTRAEEKNREAVEHLSVAIKAISEIVVEQCDGYDNFNDTYKKTLRCVLAELLDQRTKLQ